MLYLGDRRTRRCLSLVGMLLPWVLAGCQHHADYQAANLPPELQAPVIRGAHRLDLASLTQSTIDNERIHIGDVLEVRAHSGLEDEKTPAWNLRVDNDGNIDVPLVGKVAVAGLKLVDAEQAVGSACIQQQIYRTPKVAVQIATRKANRVTVMGAVEKPGVYELPVGGSDVIAALAAAGGLNKEADTLVEIHYPSNQQAVVDSTTNVPGQHVELASHAASPGTTPSGMGPASGDAHSIKLDLAEVDKRSQDLRVADGSTVVIHEKPLRSVSVLGLVKAPQQFDLPTDREIRVLDALAFAGGRSMQVADQLKIVRMDPNGGPPIVISCSVEEAKRNGQANIRLAPGDVVSVEETPLTFTIDTLRSFIRFGFSAGIPGF